MKIRRPQVTRVPNREVDHDELRAIIDRVPLWLKIHLHAVQRRFPRRLVFTVGLENTSPQRQAVPTGNPYTVPSQFWRLTASSGRIVEPEDQKAVYVSYSELPPLLFYSIEPQTCWRWRKWGRIANNRLSIHYSVSYSTCSWPIVRGEIYHIQHGYGGVWSNECVWTYI
jgi:hypothetical protein